MDFAELVTMTLINDEVENETVFVNKTGDRIVYIDGALRHLLRNGIVSSPVTLTNDIVSAEWHTIDAYTTVKITMGEALERLSKREPVRVIVNLNISRTIENDLGTIDSLTQLNEMIAEGIVSLYELYHQAKFCFEKKEEQPRVQKDTYSVDTTTPKKHSGRKLTEGEAEAILYDRHYNKKSVKDIAEKYGVTERMVYYVLDGTYWFNVWKEFHAIYDIVVDDYFG